MLTTLVTLTARSRFNDPDLWWHLKTGQFLWTTHTIPTIDHFSFTAYGQKWIPHEWLSQAILFEAWHLGGNRGLMLLFLVLASAVVVGGYHLCSSYAQHPKVAFLGALAVFVFATSGFSLRPQLIGYLLLIAEMALLQLGRRRNPAYFYTLPLLFAIWVNCHGSFFLGLILAALLFATSFFSFTYGGLIADAWKPAQRKALGIAIGLSAFATLLNPGGIRQVFYPLDTLFHQPINLAAIEEWKPLALNSQRGVCVLAVLGVILLIVLLRKAALYLDEAMLLVLGLWLAGSHQRLTFVFGILAAPILTRMLAELWEPYNAARDRILPNALLLTLAFAATIAAFPSQQMLVSEIASENPTGAVAWLKAHPIPGHMLNEYQYGGYLIWALPEHPVFVDGRADLYEWAGVLGPYTAWSGMQADPNLLLDKYRINLCLLAPQSPMANVLRLLPAWKQVYIDKNDVLFERVSLPQ